MEGHTGYVLWSFGEPIAKTVADTETWNLLAAEDLHPQQKYKHAGFE